LYHAAPVIIPSLSSDTRGLARVLALFLMVISVGIIFGWQFEIPLLKGELFGTFVAPNTALLFLISSISLLLANSDSRFDKNASPVLGMFVFIAGLTVLLEYLFKLDLGVDHLFLRSKLSNWYVPSLPGRFSFTTAVSFTVAGAGLTTLRISRFPFSDICAGFIALLSYLGAIGYIYKATVLFGHITAIHTILLFAVLSVSLWCSASTPRFVALATSDFAGGFLARRVISAILVLLPFFGWLEIRGRQMELFDRELGIALLVVVSASVITILTLHTASVLNDVDRRRLQAESVLIRTEKLAAAGRMAATIAHEINNPLSAITNLLYLSRRPMLDSATRESYLAKAEEELNRVALIAKQTLGFYRESTSPTIVDVPKLIKEVIDLYHSRLLNRGITVEEYLEHSEPVMVAAGELRQVFANLVSNAIDACPPQKGLITVRVATRAGRMRVDIADNGTGIQESNRPKIFEAFFTTKKDVGTGLGLWVSKQLVEKNGGEISMSTNGISPGTTFTVSLPVHQGTALKASSESV
jgi:signal transduction histidine kinase